MDFDFGLKSNFFLGFQVDFFLNRTQKPQKILKQQTYVWTKKRVHQLVLLAVFWFDVQKKGSSGKQDGARYRQIQTHTDKHTRTEQQQKLKLKKEKKIQRSGGRVWVLTNNSSVWFACSVEGFSPFSQ